MTPARPTPLDDDHGDQFPGAVPARGAAHGQEVPDRVVRMNAAYLQKVNSVVEADRDDLAHELAGAFAEESTAGRHRDAGSRAAGRHAPGRGAGGRPPGRASTRLGRVTRSSLQRFDRYTLEVFNPGSPYRRDGRSA